MTALRIEIEKFHQAARQSLAITHLATCVNDIMLANLQQSAACNALHDLEFRLARWLLHAHDRCENDSLPLTQEFLSQMLGVRRTTVTLAAKTLQNAGLVNYRRGKIEIVDRAGLEAISCKCYGVICRNVELIIQSVRPTTVKA
jgi:CRP-like cAMP-binding protein